MAASHNTANWQTATTADCRDFSTFLAVTFHFPNVFWKQRLYSWNRHKRQWYDFKFAALPSNEDLVTNRQDPLPSGRSIIEKCGAGNDLVLIFIFVVRIGKKNGISSDFFTLSFSKRYVQACSSANVFLAFSFIDIGWWSRWQVRRCVGMCSWTRKVIRRPWMRTRTQALNRWKKKGDGLSYFRRAAG